MLESRYAMRVFPYLSLKLLTAVLAGYSLCTLGALCLTNGAENPQTYAPSFSAGSGSKAPAAFELRGAEGKWFNGVNQHCNSLEVELTLRGNPPPGTDRGAGLAGLCYALAGKIQSADAIFAKLPESIRAEPLRILVQMGMSFSMERFDAGIEPSMGLVLRYLPQNKVALYLSALSEFSKGNDAKGREMLAELQRAAPILGDDPGVRQLVASPRKPEQKDLGILPVLCPNPTENGDRC